MTSLFFGILTLIFLRLCVSAWIISMNSDMWNWWIKISSSMRVYFYIFDERNTPITFSTHEFLSTFAHSFAVDPVEMTSSIRITVFGIFVWYFIVNVFTLFSSRFSRVSFDWCIFHLLRRRFWKGIHVCFDRYLTINPVWWNHRMKYRLQCIGTGTSRIFSSWFMLYWSTIFDNRSTNRSTFSRSEEYLYRVIFSSISKYVVAIYIASIEISQSSFL
jgi:hypothetical protein